MSDTQLSASSQNRTRRQFIKTAAATGAVAATLPLHRAAYAAPSGTLKVGLIGCGGRGTGAAGQALRADSSVKLVAMADAFADKIDKTLAVLQKQSDLRAKIDVPPDHKFVGFDAYKKVIDMVDVVLLTTTPHFRPMHLRYAIENGKHVFAEKPVAVDGAGVRSVLETTELAKKKGLSIVSGLCLRYYYCFQETMKRIHDGALGRIVAMQSNDYRGQIWDRTREQLTQLLGREPTEMEYQMRNWYHFTWLSGDFNVEQHVHNLDICAWALGEYPTQCVGMGSRLTRPDNGGNIYDSFSAIFEYKSGARVYSNSRQVRGVRHKNYNRISDDILGTKGHGDIDENHSRHFLNINGKEWRYTGKHNDFYQTEHDVLFKAIRDNKPVNNGEYMAKSTLMAIMERESAYTGQLITWDMALNSKQNLSPAGYTWDSAPPKSEVALPGITRFV